MINPKRRADGDMFTLSAHAARVLEEREIPSNWVRRAVAAPDYKRNDLDDVDLQHHFVAIPEHGGRILHVVVNEKATPRRIVTVFFDRRERQRT